MKFFFGKLFRLIHAIDVEKVFRFFLKNFSLQGANNLAENNLFLAQFCIGKKFIICQEWDSNPRQQLLTGILLHTISIH